MKPITKTEIEKAHDAINDGELTEEAREFLNERLGVRSLDTELGLFWGYEIARNRVKKGPSDECYRKARAWDKLEQKISTKLVNEGPLSTNFWALDLMRKTLSPIPKDPLQELEKWINQKPPLETCTVLSNILAEIQRLRKEGKK